MIFHIPKLLEFLDDPDTNAAIDSEMKNHNRGNATSIIGLIGEDLNAAAFRHYMNNKPIILRENVVQGHKKGSGLIVGLLIMIKKLFTNAKLKIGLVHHWVVEHSQ